jgi:signal transduction histidine kinase
LGLPIARIIARGHGGDIMLKRDPQGGTLAIVTLPMAPPPEGETE